MALKALTPDEITQYMDFLDKAGATDWIRDLMRRGIDLADDPEPYRVYDTAAWTGRYPRPPIRLRDLPHVLIMVPPIFGFSIGAEMISMDYGLEFWMGRGPVGDKPPIYFRWPWIKVKPGGRFGF